jgi:glyoxylase-like metal-dependent hydrolase (beta-lactamase superfamily II)
MSSGANAGGGEVVVEHFAVGPLACTCTIVAHPASGTAVVVDGGDEVESIVARLAALNVRATHLVHTHAHIDHIGALAELKDLTGALGLLHAADGPLYATLQAQARWLGVAPPRVVALDGNLAEGDVLRAGPARLEVLHTPGHTPGSISFALDDGSRTLLLTGDTLFRAAIGRWDLGGTSMEDIVASIRSKLYVYPDETAVVPGHGPFTTIGQEKQQNPFTLESVQLD